MLAIADDPDYWRKRAEEARALADQMDELETKATMLRIAEAYDKIVQMTEERLRRQRERKLRGE